LQGKVKQKSTKVATAELEATRLKPMVLLDDLLKNMSVEVPAYEIKSVSALVNEGKTVGIKGCMSQAL